MKKLILCLTFALLPTPNYLTDRYYVAVVYDNHGVYEEYMSYKSILHLIGDFFNDNSLESLHIIKGV